MMGVRESEICWPGLLYEDCWLLLSRMALPGRNDVEFGDIGKKIAKKCKDLPLAAKTLGSLLCFKSSIEQWSNVLNSTIWQMEEAEIDIFPHLLLSYNELSPALKRCFSYCAVFPKDTQIHVESLIRDWISLGYLGSNFGDMKLKGREYFDILTMRSLFQNFVKDDLGVIIFCMMHDIVHDFAQFFRKKGRVEAMGMRKGTTCQVCDPSHVSMVNEFCVLRCSKKTLSSLCDCLVRSKVLTYRCCESIPHGFENLIHLRRLVLHKIIKLSRENLKAIFQLYHLQSLELIDCSIEEIPKEIENLVRLRSLDLINIELLKELPMEIGNLIHLKHLGLIRSKSLEQLPESMCDLQELQTLDNTGCINLCRIPERLVQKLSEFPGGVGGSKLELLKNSKHLCRVLKVKMRLDGDGDLNEVVEDARKAQLRNEINIMDFVLSFKDELGEEGSSSLSWVWMDLMDALQPHPNLKLLEINHYGGSKLPRWMVSPLNQLKSLCLSCCKQLTSLPAFGKLPCLQEIDLDRMEGLELVGREFLGITTGERGGNVIAFPKLEMMFLRRCDKLEEWEDITVEEEECAASSIMPCLTLLLINYCNGLRTLPHRLLRKVTSLETLSISHSTKLIEQYGDKEGSGWKSIPINNTALYLITKVP